MSEPIHVMTGPGGMLCGAQSGVGVNPWDMGRVTCEKCRVEVETRGVWSGGPGDGPSLAVDWVGPVVQRERDGTWTRDGVPVSD